eukprot:gene3352-39201_t
MGLCEALSRRSFRQSDTPEEREGKRLSIQAWLVCGVKYVADGLRVTSIGGIGCGVAGMTMLCGVWCLLHTHLSLRRVSEGILFTMLFC